MADHHASERRILQHRFEPLDPGKIQMVGRLVEQKNVRLLHQRRADRQALAPAARQCRRGRFKVRKARAPQRLGDPRSPLRLRNRDLFESLLDHRPDRVLRREFRNLRDEAEARALADRYFPVVRLHAAVKNFEQSRLARAVRANQADPFARRYRERNILE